MKTGKYRGKLLSSSKTLPIDSINFSEDDLDVILSRDEKNSRKEYEHLKKAGGGLDQLKNLLEMARNDSPYSTKKTSSYTPAQAQKSTYHLINTVKQLKDTMDEMTPLMASAKYMIKLKEKMKNL